MGLLQFNSTSLNSSFWADDIGLEAQNRALVNNHIPEKADVVVVGAGYTGLSAALTLARAGSHVVVLDADAIGFGCSSRNGGHIGPSFHKLGTAGIAAAHGPDLANAILKESLSGLNWLKQFIREEKIECDLQLVGRFKGAARPEHYEKLAKESEEIGKVTGFQYEMIPQNRQQDFTGSPKYFGGVLYGEDGLLHPAKYVLGLAKLVVAAGAKIVAPARVNKIERSQSGFEVWVGNQMVSAGGVLIATNGYTGPEFPYMRRRLVPIRSAIIATEDIGEDAVSACFPKGRGLIETSRLVLYPRPSPDGRRIIFGGRAFDLADRPDRYIKDLTQQMQRMFPDLATPKISHAWSGTVAYTFDHAPHLGCQDGIHYAMGYCGSGVGRATYFGRKIALKMLGDPQGKTALDALEFPSKPLYRGRPLFLPALLKWHQFMDRLGR